MPAGRGAPSGLAIEPLCGAMRRRLRYWMPPLAPVEEILNSTFRSKSLHDGVRPFVVEVMLARRLGGVGMDGAVVDRPDVAFAVPPVERRPSQRLV